MKYNQVVIWYNPHNKTYYHKKMRHLWRYLYVGYVNQFEHEVIMMIDLRDLCKPQKLGFIDKLISMSDKNK